MHKYIAKVEKRTSINEFHDTPLHDPRNSRKTYKNMDDGEAYLIRLTHGRSTRYDSRPLLEQQIRAIGLHDFVDKFRSQGKFLKRIPDTLIPKTTLSILQEEEALSLDGVARMKKIFYYVGLNNVPENDDIEKELFIRVKNIEPLILRFAIDIYNNYDPWKTITPPLSIADGFIQSRYSKYQRFYLLGLNERMLTTIFLDQLNLGLDIKLNESDQQLKDVIRKVTDASPIGERMISHSYKAGLNALLTKEINPTEKRIVLYLKVNDRISAELCIRNNFTYIKIDKQPSRLFKDCLRAYEMGLYYAAKDYTSQEEEKDSGTQKKRKLN